MAQLVALAASGRLKMIPLVGEPLKWRRASIRSVSLTPEIEDQTLVDERPASESNRSIVSACSAI